MDSNVQIWRLHNLFAFKSGEFEQNFHEKSLMPFAAPPRPFFLGLLGENSPPQKRFLKKTLVCVQTSYNISVLLNFNI
jgi:hypothetical protein